MKTEEFETTPSTYDELDKLATDQSLSRDLLGGSAEKASIESVQPTDNPNLLNDELMKDAGEAPLCDVTDILFGVT